MEPGMFRPGLFELAFIEQIPISRIKVCMNVGSIKLWIIWLQLTDY